MSLTDDELEKLRGLGQGQVPAVVEAILKAREARDERVLALVRETAEAADELDDWDGHPSPTLGGCSPGGVVRHAVQRALGISIDEWDEMRKRANA